MNENMDENIGPSDHTGLRRHARTPLALFGHYTLESRLALPCATRDLSEGGVALATPVDAQAGERVTLHLDKIGQLDGEIVRSFDGGFAIALTISDERRQELAAQMRAICESSALGLIEMPMLPDGDMDMALFGNAVTFDAAMTRGDERVQGETTARVTRGASGVAELEFLCARDCA
ncbi:MAG: pilus assembly protein PilZ [Hyphomicrobiales bacterium]|nr:pilus assembly protein PilZ [Hyphomicrobiales bacterium]